MAKRRDQRIDKEIESYFCKDLLELAFRVLKFNGNLLSLVNETVKIKSEWLQLKPLTIFTKQLKINE